MLVALVDGPLLLVGVAGFGLLLACGRPASDARRGDAGAADADSSPADVRDPESKETTPGLLETDEAAPRSDRATGLENFDLSSDPVLGATIDTISVEIENVAPVGIAVSARAGAGPAALDTVDPGERYRVDLVGPSDAIELVWKAIDGSRGGTSRLVAATPDSVIPIQLGGPEPR